MPRFHVNEMRCDADDLSSTAPVLRDSDAGLQEGLFDRLHIESMVREWCSPLRTSSGVPEGFVEGLIDVLRVRLRRADPEYLQSSKATRAASPIEPGARGLLGGKEHT